MPRKEPLYYKKSKAARQLESDYDFESESESFLRLFEKFPDRVKHQNITNQYKRKYDSPYYEDRYNKRRTQKYDEDVYFDSNYVYDSGNKYIGYVTGRSPDFTEAESVLEVHKNYKKNKKKRQSENLVDNHNNKKPKESNKYGKQRSSPLNYDEHMKTGIVDKKNFNVYISQRPITLQYESEEDLKEPSNSITRRKPRSNEHKGFKIPPADSKQLGNYEIYMTNTKDFQSNKVFGKKQHEGPPPTVTSPPDKTIFQPNLEEIITNSTQSVLRVIYLPVFVMGNNDTSQSTESVKPPELLTNSTDIMTGSQNLMSVFTAYHNTDPSNVFEQKTKTVNKEEILTPIQNPKEIKSNASLVDAKKAKELKKKLHVSTLGTDMPKENHASLITSYSEKQHTSLTKSGKKNKNKKDMNLHLIQKHSEANNEQQEHFPVKSDIIHEEMSIDNLNTIEDHRDNREHVTKQEKEKQKNEIKNSSTNNKLVEGVEGEQNNKIKLPQRSKILSQTENRDLNEKDDGESIIINIKENSFFSNNLPPPYQTKEKEINLNSRVTERQSLINRKNELKVIKEPEFGNIIKSQKIAGEYNIDLSQSQSNRSKKSSLVSKNYSVVSQGTMITGNYKQVGSTQNGVNTLRHPAIPEEESICVMGPTNTLVMFGNVGSEANNFNKITKYDNTKKYEEEKHVVPQDKGFVREISVNELNEISGKGNNNLEEKKMLNNSKGSSLVKQNSSYIQGLKNYEGGSKMNQYNQNSGGERKTQQEDENFKKSTLSKPQSKKPLSALASKDQEVNRLGKASQSSTSVLYKKDIGINNNLEVMENVNDQSVHKRHGDDNLSESSEEGPPLEILYRPFIKSSAVGKQSTSNVLFTQNEEPSYPLSGHFSKLSEYKESIFIFFHTAQIILGVSCFDQFLNLFDVLYF